MKGWNRNKAVSHPLAHYIPATTVAGPGKAYPGTQSMSPVWWHHRCFQRWALAGNSNLVHRFRTKFWHSSMRCKCPKWHPNHWVKHLPENKSIFKNPFSVNCLKYSFRDYTLKEYNGKGRKKMGRMKVFRLFSLYTPNTK